MTTTLPLLPHTFPCCCHAHTRNPCSSRQKFCGTPSPYFCKISFVFVGIFTNLTHKEKLHRVEIVEWIENSFMYQIYTEGYSQQDKYFCHVPVIKVENFRRFSISLYLYFSVIEKNTVSMLLCANIISWIYMNPMQNTSLMAPWFCHAGHVLRQISVHNYTSTWPRTMIFWSKLYPLNTACDSHWVTVQLFIPFLDLYPGSTLHLYLGHFQIYRGMSRGEDLRQMDWKDREFYDSPLVHLISVMYPSVSSHLSRETYRFLQYPTKNGFLYCVLLATVYEDWNLYAKQLMFYIFWKNKG